MIHDPVVSPVSFPSSFSSLPVSHQLDVLRRRLGFVFDVEHEPCVDTVSVVSAWFVKVVRRRCGTEIWIRSGRRGVWVSRADVLPPSLLLVLGVTQRPGDSVWRVGRSVADWFSWFSDVRNLGEGVSVETLSVRKTVGHWCLSVCEQRHRVVRGGVFRVTPLWDGSSQSWTLSSSSRSLEEDVSRIAALSPWAKHPFSQNSFVDSGQAVLV